MKKNLNDKVVVLDKDIYVRLLNLAGIGAFEISREPEFKDLARHARKFNPHLQPAHAEFVAEQDQKRWYERHQYRRARRIVSNRNGILHGRDVNGCVKIVKYQREFYFLTHDKQAFPIYVTGFAPNYGKTGVKIQFIDPEHKELARQFGNEVVAKNIAETVDEIPVNYKRHYVKVDLRTGNECCADPCVTFDSKCENCGNVEEDKCCESMSLDYKGKCIMCGDTSAQIEVEGEKKCCENEDRTVWGDCVSCGDNSSQIEVEGEEKCCDNEDRNNWGGGCTNCGDPCL